MRLLPLGLLLLLNIELRAQSVTTSFFKNPKSCAGGTNTNCDLTSTKSGATTGTCTAGYTGSCSFKCFRGTWSSQSNSCAPLATQVAFTSGNFDGSSGGSRTFTAQSIGAPSANRIVAVIVGWGISGSTNLSSATIGGIAATIAGQNDGTNVGDAIIWAKVPTGTTADIVLNWSASIARSSIVVFQITNQTADAPSVTVAPAGGADQARSISTLTGSANGIYIAGSVSGTMSDTTWTNITESYESGGASHGFSGAYGLGNPTGITMTNSQCRVMIAASWL